jgi:hypothetical protein
MQVSLEREVPRISAECAIVIYKVCKAARLLSCYSRVMWTIR